ncbi:MAG: anti-sigma factor [Gammaproteobacteria bacterium]
MSIPEETLMAYADGELGPTQRAEVAAALAADPLLAERVERHRALRRKLNAAFDPTLMETVPDALIATVQTSPATPPGAATERAATVTDLRRVRAARAAEAKGAATTVRRSDGPRRPWTWFEWSAMAASLATGAVIAHLALKSPDASRIGTVGGRLVAQADLSQALTTQLASDQSADAPVRIGVTFKSKSGNTCRTFTLNEQTVLGGLACRQGDEWHVQALANAPPDTTGQGGYKPAGGGMPAAVLTAVEQQIEGEPLDAAGETAARARGWK